MKVKNDFNIVIANDGSSNLTKVEILYYFNDVHGFASENKQAVPSNIQMLEINASSNRLAVQTEFRTRDNALIIRTDIFAKDESLLIFGVLDRPAVFYAELSSNEDGYQERFLPDCETKSVELLGVFPVEETYFGPSCKAGNDKRHSCTVENTVSFNIPQDVAPGKKIREEYDVQGTGSEYFLDLMFSRGNIPVSP